ncbi:F-box domain-containing protein [Rhynchospora pubera]|uniref:F-box domain-containing protein n=1 Tax=Rhynchospora pubera TaxID=906938 RepID=A0AAV8H0W3_9POAL|nr:F-box domain-containing protein [Rhynchospora pubera]
MEMKRYIKKIINKIRGKRESKLQRTADWSELLPELLDLISQKLPDICDFVRIRAVCVKWRLSLQHFNPAYPRGFFPWIHPVHYSINDMRHRFLLVTQFPYKLLSLSLPESSFCYPHDRDGFLLFYEPTDESTLFIFNPLTRTKICLPSLSSLGVDYILGTMHPIRVCPNRTGQCVFLFEVRNEPLNSALVSCRVGDERWTLARVPYGLNYLTSIDVLYKDKYLVSFHKNFGGITTRVFDVATGSELYTIKTPRTKTNTDNSLVECSGELLWVAERWTGRMLTQENIHIYQLDLEKLQWTEKSNIGNNILFIDRSPDGFSVDTSNFPGHKGNCIFMIKDFFMQDSSGKRFYAVYRYDLENGRTEEVWRPGCWCYWYMPSLIH